MPARGLVLALLAAAAAGAPQPPLPVASAPPSCDAALTASCSTDWAKAQSPFSSEPCAVCCGHLQHQLKAAGCSHGDLTHYCSTPPNGWPALLPRFEIAPGVHLPATNVGHPDDGTPLQHFIVYLWLVFCGFVKL